MLDDTQVQTLAEMVRSYLDDPEVALRPDELEREIRLNTWRYGVCGPVDVEATVMALDVVQRELRRRLADQPNPGTFYAWYDEQAGQLRCSLTSASPGRLPFSGTYRVTGDAAEVVALAAADLDPGHVPSDDLTEITRSINDDEAIPLPAFPVWAVVVR
ncbi:hypothetical protein Cs7R123_43740 [Catellatospora sp. TT07R-123]|uniref:hypothetical protein n=1 Tax=Catellatospora sp. TT07R-123 TaxID=2733863 RepID=UPI001B133C49|nr:hypothetical protein [Catellatospora sp. TT07R-123]GHJ47032.1 hypothetical protein Cs7R123_43740 [Catellatospora sp. TT07R-123]